MQKLNITGRRTNFLLSTMGQEAVVPAYSLTGLEVAELDGNDFHILPEVLTQRKMPVTAENMATPEELAEWPYLANIHIPHLKANVDLLIGTNAPKMLEPWEVINSHGNGPYAIRTVLGWVVNGPLTGNSGVVEAECPSAIVNRISVCRVEDKLTNHGFGRVAVQENGVSGEDLGFQERVESSAVLQEGRYCLKLPFKKEFLLSFYHCLNTIKGRTNFL